MGHSVHCRSACTHLLWQSVPWYLRCILLHFSVSPPPPPTPNPPVLVFLQQFVLKDSPRSLFVAVCLQKYWHVSDVSAVMHIQVQWSPLETEWLELLPPDSNMSVSTHSLPLGHPNAIQYNLIAKCQGYCTRNVWVCQVDSLAHSHQSSNDSYIITLTTTKIMMILVKFAILFAYAH